MEFKDRLKKLRKEFNLTQKELGEKVNLAESTISHYENKIRTPDSAKLEEFANLFDVSVDYLLCRTNSRKEIISDPTDAELEEFIQKSNVKFNGAPLDEDDKEDILNFLKMVNRRKKTK